MLNIHRIVTWQLNGFSFAKPKITFLKNKDTKKTVAKIFSNITEKCSSNTNKISLLFRVVDRLTVELM